MRSKVLSGLCIAAACTSLGACAGVKPLSPTGGAGTSGNDSSITPPRQDGGPSFDIVTADLSIAPQHSVCGDGVRSQDEACDDGNAMGDDGWRRRRNPQQKNTTRQRPRGGPRPPPPHLPPLRSPVFVHAARTALPPH